MSLKRHYDVGTTFKLFGELLYRLATLITFCPFHLFTCVSDGAVLHLSRHPSLTGNYSFGICLIIVIPKINLEQLLRCFALVRCR